jgi:hypothetical protein
LYRTFDKNKSYKKTIIKEIKSFFLNFSDDDDDISLSEAFVNNPTKLLSIAFSFITLVLIAPILYLIILFEKVTLLIVLQTSKLLKDNLW